MKSGRCERHLPDRYIYIYCAQRWKYTFQSD